MLVDFKTHIEAITGLSSFPVTIPQGACIPCTTYKVISKPRDGDSKLGTSQIREWNVQVTIVARNPADLYKTSETLDSAIEGFSGLMGSTNVLSARVGGAVDLFNTTSKNYEQAIDVTLKILE